MAHPALVGGALQALQYVILAVNFRAIAHEQYVAAGGTAMVASFLAAVIVRRVVHDDSWRTVVGMMVGGGLADMCGIYLTRSWS